MKQQAIVYFNDNTSRYHFVYPNGLKNIVFDIVDILIECDDNDWEMLYKGVIK